MRLSSLADYAVVMLTAAARHCGGAARLSAGTRGSLPGTDMPESLRMLRGELGDPHQGALPVLPETGWAGTRLARTVATLGGLSADLQAAGWRLRESPGREARTAAARLSSDVQALADAIGADAHVPLTSDLDPARVPALVPAEDRRDFVAVGRLNTYKNLDVTLAAWDRHVSGPGWRGDELVLIGDGDGPADLAPHVRWERGPYSYADVLGPMSAAKGSIAHYRRATQSGVQVLAMQLGVTPIVSLEGALPEFQPMGEPGIPADDVAGLARGGDKKQIAAVVHGQNRRWRLTDKREQLSIQ